MSVNIRSFLINQGLIGPSEMPSASGEYRAVCPECENPKSKFFINALGKGVSCKHCGFGSSWRAFQRRYEPPTPQEVALESFVKQTETSLWNDHPELVEYLRERGFTDDTIKSARLGYCDPASVTAVAEGDYIATKLFDNERQEWRLHDRITIPYIRDGIVLKVRGRVTPKKESEIKYLDCAGAEIMPYIHANIDPSKPVIISEGEFDALRLVQEGFQAIGTPGANSFRPEWVTHYGDIYIAFDGDKAGRSGAEKLKQVLPEVRVVDLPEGFDCSDYLGVFGADTFRALVDGATLYINARPQREDRLAKTIEAWADWAYSNNELLGPRIGWAPRLQQAISGWSKGLFLIGSLPNSGKSCMMVKSAYECAVENTDAVVVYLSLDDDLEDAVTRLVALRTGISFEQVRSPRWYFDHPTDSSKRNPQMIQELNEALHGLGRIENLVVRDAKYGRSLSYLRSYFSSLRNRFLDRPIVVFIDSLAKVTSDEESIDTSNQNAWKSFLASELKYLSTVYGLCIVTPADLRKLNDGRRPTNDDLRDSSSLAYESNCILLAFNEMNANQQKRDSLLKWSDPETGEENPILELAISKNKRALFKGVIRYRFHLRTSNFEELTRDEDEELDAMLAEEEAEKKERSR